jgi:hypothetical protein
MRELGQCSAEELLEAASIGGPELAESFFGGGGLIA